MILSQQQKNDFAEQGWLLVRNFFSDEELQPTIDDIQQFIDQGARELVAQGKLSQTYEQESFRTRLTRISEETEDLLSEADLDEIASIHGDDTQPR